MQITAYSNFSKKINSTKVPSGGTSMEVTLKEPTSVVSPIFRVHHYSLNHNYLKWGNRYYYIDDIIVNTAEEAEYHCTTDVLATYKGDIGASRQYVTRSSSVFNTNVQDTRYPTLADPITKYQTYSVINTAFSQGGYVLGVISKGAEGVTYYRLSRLDFANFLDYMFGGQWLQADEIGSELQKELVNPFQYVTSCMWFPFLDGGGGSFDDEISFGYWGDTGCYGHIINDSNRSYIISDHINVERHPQASTRGNYLNGAPYTRIMLEAYCFGCIPIDANYLVGDDSLTTRILVDKYTGLGEIIISNRGHIITKQTAQVGVPIQISQVTQPILQPVLSAVNTVTNFATKNWVGGIQGIGNTIQSAMPQVHTAGSMGSKIAYERPCGVYTQFYSISDEDNESIGRPLCSVRQISSLQGYIECDNVELDTRANSVEKSQIISYMQGGFFYE